MIEPIEPDHITVGRRGAVLVLTIARPEKKNAITNAMYGALADAIEGADADTTVRVMLIRADGEMFTAGNDLAEFAAFGREGSSAQRHVGRFLRALATASKPIVAAVRGKAVGVGTTMLLHCDHVVLADNAELITPFVNLALVPEAGSSLLLPSRIGHVRAFAMFALGEPVAAPEALAWGLANRIVPLADLDDAAQDVADRLARQPMGALVATKRLMRDVSTITTVIEAEGREFTERPGSAEAREAFAAFAERRRPDFTSVGQDPA